MLFITFLQSAWSSFRNELISWFSRASRPSEINDSKSCNKAMYSTLCNGQRATTNSRKLGQRSNLSPAHLAVAAHFKQYWLENKKRLPQPEMDIVNNYENENPSFDVTKGIIGTGKDYNQKNIDILKALITRLISINKARVESTKSSISGIDELAKRLPGIETASFIQPLIAGLEKISQSLPYPHLRMKWKDLLDSQQGQLRPVQGFWWHKLKTSMSKDKHALGILLNSIPIKPKQNQNAYLEIVEKSLLDFAVMICNRIIGNSVAPSQEIDPSISSYRVG